MSAPAPATNFETKADDMPSLLAIQVSCSHSGGYHCSTRTSRVTRIEGMQVNLGLGSARSEGKSMMRQQRNQSRSAGIRGDVKDSKRAFVDSIHWRHDRGMSNIHLHLGDFQYASQVRAQANPHMCGRRQRTEKAMRLQLEDSGPTG